MVSVSVRRELLRLTVPVFIDIALVMLLGAVDTIMLSRHSDNAVAAVGIGNQLVSLVFLVYQFVSMGAAILCAQYFGARLRLRFMQIVAISVIVNTLLGMAVSGVLWLWAEPLLRAFGLREALMADGAVYLRITGALSFFQALSLTFSAALRSTGKTVQPMVATAAVNVLNIAANYALIFGHWGCPAMGVEGAAWATAGSRVAATFILMAFLPRLWPTQDVRMKECKDVSLGCKDVKMKERKNGLAQQFLHPYILTPLHLLRPFPWQELRNLFHIGVPAMSEELSYALSQIVITFFINQISTEALTAKVYCATAIMFVILMSSSITQGGDIIVGHYVGQRRYRAAYVLGNYIERTGMRLSLVVSAMLALGGHWVMRALTANEEIVWLGTWVFAIDFFLSYGRVKNIFACGTLRAAGDAVYPVIVGVTCQWSIAVALSWLLGIPLGLGLLGMWCGFCLDENIRGVILMRRWHSKKWCGKGFV